MKLVFMGTPEFAVPILRGLIGAGYDVSAVYTRPDAPAGRGRSLTASPVKALADSSGLKIVQPRSLKKPEVADELRSLAPDAIIVAAYGLILPQSVLQIPVHGCINVHASLLPRHRGAAPVAAAILAGDEFTGISIMRMDAGIDTGPVFATASIPICDNDTTGSLTERLAYLGSNLLLEVLSRITGGEISPAPQPAAGATYAPMLAKEQGCIDWNRSAIEIWRQVRAFQPWPGAFTTWDGRLLKLIETQPLDIPAAAPAGTVTALAGRPSMPFEIVTGDGVLGVKRLQLEGKKAATAEEFLRGARGLAGAILG
ncbi:methionyl-tRNA formyltransferase [Dehalogenimonas alkenigignens]|uniref:Methionyl-tRNA formyltransferase n=1 Tax=Dehalogenimonas alkenigignens TaxID=1217799 RepID=A0A0W0GHB6_9CHLR|nr:methionyl-tRNA formyltransferase [Dehalogenimonas alkenigignens]KTB47948.1 methionyl-tRNA formyltransferase [Dehalogenimonas alkenigignens]PVV82476.1 methionyl-tRNA formyltransferase [Dehalogenimonas alkenigignens]